MHNKAFGYGLSLLTITLMVSCGSDDLKNANSVSVQEVSSTRDRTLGVDVVYSDSGRVKAKGLAPIMDKVTPATGGSYQEMPKGVKIDFYNPNGQVDGTLISDYAIRKDQELKTIFRKHVVAKNSNGYVYSSEELIWDEAKKIFYSNMTVDVTSPDGSTLRTVDFTAPQDFSSYTAGKGSAVIVQKEGFP